MNKYIITALVGAATATDACYKRTNKPKPGFVKKPLEPVDDLPREHIWNNVNGTNYLTNIKNQHIPQYCGSCWSQAATSALSDRIKIVRDAAWPDFNVAPQVPISCVYGEDDDGCHGGEPYDVYEWLHDNEGTDETCSIYRARGKDNGAECAPMLKCMNCMPGEPCFIPDSYYVFKTDEYGNVNGTAAMM